jgi:prepilin-type N-terminal cleavage/methylation domain-containing protein
MISQKGITLVELLTALTILGIFSIGIYSFIYTTFKTNETTNQKINLTTEANLIISQIEKEFYTKDSFQIKNEDDILKLKTADNWVDLHDSKITIEEINIVIPGEGPITGDPWTIKPKVHKSIDISLKLKTTKGNVYQLEIETTLNRY